MSSTDSKVSSIAFGFALGFGYLTAWDAWKITSRNRNPLRSIFVWMVWGELAVNLTIAILAWLFLEGVIPATLPTFFFILFMWVFEIQFILQIIINRVAIISTDYRAVRWIRWTTIIFITLINISVFCIWIPAHMGVSDTYVRVNDVWDKITKVLIGLNDAVLNFYFIQQVKKRLVANGLQKYNALARFNTQIIMISIGMDLLIIGTMFLKNGAVFMQFHPVAYTVKLKIELSMTNLITRISKESINERMGTTSTSNAYASRGFGATARTTGARNTVATDTKAVPLDVFPEQTHTQISAGHHNKRGGMGGDDDDVVPKPGPGALGHIYTKREVHVQVSGPEHEMTPPSEHASSRGSKEDERMYEYAGSRDDEYPLSGRRP